MTNSFKKILFPALLTVAAFISIAYASCTKGKDASCAYGGTYVNHVCQCVAGYEGPYCATISRLKFLTTTTNWQVTETGSATNRSQYSVSIQPAAAITGVTITNFYNYFLKPINATISYDTITIPNQELEGKVIFGTGFIYSTTSDSTSYNAISMRYEVVDTATGLVNDFGYYPDGSSASSWNE